VFFYKLKEKRSKSSIRDNGENMRNMGIVGTMRIADTRTTWYVLSIKKQCRFLLFF